jgi:hypothetical protein
LRTTAADRSGWAAYLDTFDIDEMVVKNLLGHVKQGEQLVVGYFEVAHYRTIQDAGRSNTRSALFSCCDDVMAPQDRQLLRKMALLNVVI